MKDIVSYKKDRKVARWQRIKEFFFKIFVVRKIIKIISKTYYNLVSKTNKHHDSIFMVPHEFKKYSNEQIEHALDILVKNEKLLSWCKKTQRNEDGYLLVLNRQNRSQSRIYNNIPEEIDLNQVKTEPVALQATEKPAAETQPIPTNQNTQSAKVEEHELPTTDSEDIDDGKPF